ncbi:PilT protein domain protein [Beutenbergia cavernae DSM 12333]|uniref:PilT protein domain protein n=1 Tax=Beutenbergia cavernae (strain ATCC BAA-8 / DSM 12333 / CCUG 43141 / JCM 11478 / NBRC 16432 / NCIMB 13614 / HKI 0122) TaxID=471853 RepID=C5C1Z9_BEUC1|nr:type II toxin-antitoxin system VapC family toxin [Beutenbergia cavernae]ACQ81624.1 PilT protein domain protein [Beutenbergia cavernae DSM 12333]
MALTYLDTSASAKLIAVEAESAALADYLRASPDAEAVTSVVGIVELLRVGARLGPAQRLRAVDLAARLGTIALTESIARAAADAAPANLRTLDAIHVASAVVAGAESVVSYDARLSEAAVAAGLRVVAPGT